MILSDEPIENSVTIGVSYNQRLMTTIVHQAGDIQDKTDASRFDTTVILTPSIVLRGDPIDGQFAQIKIYDRFMSKQYLIKCTEQFDIIPPAVKVCEEPDLYSSLTSESLNMNGDIIFLNGFGTLTGNSYVTETGLHLIQGGQLSVTIPGASLARNPFTAAFYFRVREMVET